MCEARLAKGRFVGSALGFVLMACAAAPVVPNQTAPSAPTRAAKAVAPLSFDTSLPVQSLATGEDVAALCDRLRDEGRGSFAGNEVAQERARSAQRSRREEAAARFYVTEVPAGAFAFSYDLPAERLTVETQTFALGGGAEIYLADSERTLQFPLAPDAADAVARAHADGQVALRLLFRPAPSTVRDELCLRLGGGIAKLGITALAGALVGGDGKTVARTDTDAYREARATHVAVKKPQVRVGLPQSDDRKELPREIVDASSALGPKLLSCYQQALGTSPRLRGTLVVGGRLAADGHFEGPHMELNAVKNDGLVACVLDRLGRAKLGSAGGAIRISLPITFGGAEEL